MEIQTKENLNQKQIRPQKTDADENTHTLIPLLLNAEETSGILGISRSNFYALLSAGRIGPAPIHLGKRVLWKRSEIENWVQADCPVRQKWSILKQSRKITA
jgi:predicted DNA-binding transcriptional regulator AlpA